MSAGRKNLAAPAVGDQRQQLECYVSIVTQQRPQKLRHGKYAS